MFLTREEEAILAGEGGRASQKAMQLLVALGDVFGAERLVEVESAQIAGVSYGNIGEAGMEFLEDWAGSGAAVRVRSTLNPAGMDLERWREMGVDEGYGSKQMRIIRAFERMGTERTCTCTPYLVGNRPGRGAHIAWSESSAVGYANSVLGAMTNREGGPSALASAITGRTPYYGLHLREGRRPTAEIDVKVKLVTDYDYSLLGYAVGRALGSGIPFFRGAGRPDSDRLKIMSAALAASGGIAMFHVKGVTPETRLKEGGLERICIEQRDLDAARERLGCGSGGEPDLACIGCPHCSVRELGNLAALLKGKRVARGKGLAVWTSKGAYAEAEGRGYIRLIEGAGGKVFTDTCMVVCPLERSGFRHMVSNSCKAAHYVPSTSGLEASVAETCVAVGRVLEGA